MDWRDLQACCKIDLLYDVLLSQISFLDVNDDPVLPVHREAHLHPANVSSEFVQANWSDTCIACRKEHRENIHLLEMAKFPGDLLSRGKTRIKIELFSSWVVDQDMIRQLFFENAGRFALPIFTSSDPACKKYIYLRRGLRKRFNFRQILIRCCKNDSHVLILRQNIIEFVLR